DNRQTPFYETTYLFQCAIVLITSSVQCSINSVFLIFCLNLNAQFEILLVQFRNLKLVTEKKMIEQLKHLIEVHNLLLRFSKEIEETYSIMILTEFLLSSVFLCLTAFQMFTLDLSKYLDYTQSCSCLAAMMVEIYFFCSVAQDLTTLSSEVADAVFESQWIYFPQNIKFMLLMVMVRCKRPAALTLGKFGIMSLASFRAVLSTAASYVTLLESVHNK
ncbi:Odorant receptor Or116, partial [Rhyzopertha dominica]